MCKVSVIIPTYNRKDLLGRSVESVLNQTYSDFELIIVDDCSTDGTEELVKSWDDARIRYIRNDNNRGAGGARNVGIAASKGEFIAFQDSDDEWYPDKLQKQMAAFENLNQETAFVFCRYHYVNEFLKIEGTSPDEIITQAEITFSTLLLHNFVGAPTMVIRRDALMDVGGFDESYLCLEDYALVLALTEKYKALLLDEVLMTAYGNYGSISFDSANYYNARLSIFKKYRQQIFRYGLSYELYMDILRRAENTSYHSPVKVALDSILTEKPLYTKKISIVIPCHNSVKYLPECLRSLEAQTIGMESMEIILVNDASTDDTYEMLLEFEQKYPESVLVINLDENLRQGGARNVGIDYAGGEYLAFLDSDDLADPQTYEQLYNIAKKHDTDIIQFNHCNFTPSGKELVQNTKEEALYWIENENDRRNLLTSNYLSYGCWNKLYRTSLVKDVGSRYAEHVIFEEPPFVYPLLFYAKTIYTTARAFYNIRLHDDSTMSADVRENRIQNHPEAQMVLLRDLIGRKWIMDKYYEEVSSYFIWTYYVETLIISGQSNLQIDSGYFKNMQNMVLSLFPDYMENPLINYQGSPYFPALDSLGKEFSQAQLNALCKACANSLKKEEA